MEEGYIGNKYIVDPREIETGQGKWNTLDVRVLQITGEEKKVIGHYLRSYHAISKTFFPFILNGKELALYSRDYMYTRVMELPSCKDLGGEDQDNTEGKDHFCPVELYVPVYRTLTFPERGGKTSSDWLRGDECFDPEYDDPDYPLGPIQYCDFGFVAGCRWGDDTSWKIQFLDLSKADQGIITRDDRFGETHLPRGMNLAQAIHMDNWQPGHNWVGITNTRWVNFEKLKKP